MANVLAELFQDIATAIREKSSETGTMKPAEFPDKIRAIESGGGSCNHVPLIVTENGVYRPTKETLAFGGTYTFKDSYTQEELKVFYDAYYDETEDAAILYTNGEAYGVAVTSVPLDDAVLYLLTAMNSDGNFIYVTEEVASTVGFSAHGWMITGSDDVPVSADTPTLTFEESGTLYVPSLSDLKSLFALSDADGFSEVTVNVEGGGTGSGSAELIPLKVTTNGMYYPPTGNVEIGGTYTFKDSYTQEELQALYDISEQKSDDNVYAYLCPSVDETHGTLGIMSQYGMYCVYDSSGYVWIPSALASQMGTTEGWHQGLDITALTKIDEAPSYEFLEGVSPCVDDITSLNVLFELPSADGFSSVEVKVDRENDDTYTVHEFDFVAESKTQFVSWNIGQVPDVTILTNTKVPVPGSIIMAVMYNKAMMEKFSNTIRGVYQFSIPMSSTDEEGNSIIKGAMSFQHLDYPIEEESSDSWQTNIAGCPRLATTEGFLIGSGTEAESNKYGLTVGDTYRIFAITGIT